MKVLKFSSQTCMPCKQLGKIIETLDSDTKARFQDVKSETDITVFMKYGVRAVPTLIVIDEAENEVRRHTGMMTKDELVKFLGS